MKSSKEIFLNLTLPSKKWDHYFDIYDRYLSRYIGKNANILEIGIDKGGSLELWHKFLENSTIYGIDSNPEIKNINFDFNVDLELGDQADITFWQNYLNIRPEFDIIIDDGGHHMGQQITTLISIFPRLREGGVYIIEDVHTSYVKSYGGGFKSPESLVEVCKGLIEMINYEFITELNPPEQLAQIFYNLCNISFYNSVIVLEKRVRPKIVPLEVNYPKNES